MMPAANFTGTAALSAEEVRVLGCLLEKQRTTPEQYPLTLNALRLACNQSTNRDPVMQLEQTAIRVALHRLERRGLARLASGRGSRAAKYRHLLADALPMREEEQALMCVLMLRGPQTPGELKQRGDRMHAFAGLEAVQAGLAGLIERGLATSAGRRPGQKEERFAHLLGGEQAEASNGSGSPQLEPPSQGGEQAAGAVTLQALAERLERVERRVAELEAGVAGARGDGAARAGEGAGVR